MWLKARSGKTTALQVGDVEGASLGQALLHRPGPQCPAVSQLSPRGQLKTDESLSHSGILRCCQGMHCEEWLGDCAAMTHDRTITASPPFPPALKVE